MKYGLIGNPLGHSFSKQIHDKIGLYDYEIKELPEKELPDFLKKRDFCAINVTIPYKEVVIPFLDYIDPVAQRIGAVNTIVNRNGELYGYNTDHIGLKKLIQRVYPDMKNKKCIVAGTGGTSKTACAVLEDMGASSIVVLGRNGKGDADYSETDKYSDGDFFINTTSLGMFPNNDACPIDIALFKKLGGVVDVVYNPLRTQLILSAQEKNIPAEGGLYMLVSQAVATAEYFTEEKQDTCVTDRIFSELYGEMRNIVLIGMPSCGKTTLGKALADKLGLPWLDTDEIIEKSLQMSIKDFFAERGEAAFRDMETQLIRREIRNMHGAIISTGGGMILRDENRKMLKENGTLFFIDRPLSSLASTDSRPLSAERNSLEALYNTRYPVYLKSADIHFNASDDVDKNIKSLEELI